MKKKMAMFASPSLALLLGCSPQLKQMDAEVEGLDRGTELTTPTSCERLDTEIDLVGGPPELRARVSSVASQGIAVVRYSHEGCKAKLEVLSQCISRQAAYRYTPYTERRTKTAKNSAEASAAFPLSQGKLAAKLSQGKHLRADYRLAGVDRLPIGMEVNTGELTGACDGATHVVTAIFRGAFGMVAGSEQALGAEAVVAKGELSSERELLEAAGKDSACDGASADKAVGCDVPLMLELAPLPAQSQKVPLPEPRTDRPWMNKGPKLVYRDGASCPEGMVSFNGGTFMMGADDEGDMEGPAHEVETPPFCLDQTEVTVDAYSECVSAQLCPLHPTHCQKELSSGHPMPCLGFEEAELYCEWRGKRLPREAEWEFAARAGALGNKYPTGPRPPTAKTACIGFDYGDDASCRVASRPKEPSGLYDMAGNLAEYVIGGYQAYPGSKALYWKTPTTTPVTRGGSYYSESRTHTSAARVQSNDSRGVGFRCAL